MKHWTKPHKSLRECSCAQRWIPIQGNWRGGESVWHKEIGGLSGLGGSDMKEGKHREAERSEVQVPAVQEELEGSPLGCGS